MSFQLKVQRLTYEKVGKIAYNFLKAHNHEESIPIPIEEIIEFDLNINIVPVPELQDLIKAEGYTTGDMDCIEVDQFIFERREKRFRFTIAHELGHIVLHDELFKEAQDHYSNVTEWKDIYLHLDEEQHKWLEWQAYSFGGLVLVPAVHLERIFSRRIKEYSEQFKMAKKRKIPRQVYSDYFLLQTTEELSAIFNVSKDVINKRIIKDELLRIIP